MHGDGVTPIKNAEGFIPQREKLSGKGSEAGELWHVHLLCRMGGPVGGKPKQRRTPFAHRITHPTKLGNDDAQGTKDLQRKITLTS